jgi:hypothetical protein
MKFADNAGICELVVHRHSFHETGNVFPIECDVRGIAGDDPPPNSEGLRSGSWFGYSRRSVLTTAGEKNKEDEEKKKLARHRRTPRSMIIVETRDYAEVD